MNLRVTTSYTPTGADPYGFFFGPYDVANNYYFPNNDVNTNTHTSLTGDVYVMSPNITTTDNHLWINTTAGSGMYDFTINVANVFCSSMPPPLPATINSTTYTGSNLYGTGTITINGTVVLNACTLQMSGSCKIVVPNGSVLRIDNSWLRACDICMWYGIEVQPGGQLYIQNGSLIEDAVRAVYTLPQINSGVVPYIDVLFSVFNHNKTAIFIDHNLNDFNGSFKLTGSVFTCRQIPFQTFNGMPGFFTFYNLATSNPLGFNTAYPPVNTLQGKRSEYGIRVMNNFSAGATHYFPAKGITYNLVYDNLDFGVSGIGSNIEIANSHFQNIRGKHVSGLLGVGVHFVSNLDYLKLYAHENYFYNVFQGIYVQDYHYINIDYNDFDNDTTSSLFKGANPDKLGYIGIGVKQLNLVGPIDWVIKNNLIYNNNIGININKINTNSIINQFQIICNSIAGVGSYPKHYCAVGIQWDETSNCLSTGTAPLIQSNNFNWVKSSAIRLNACVNPIIIRGNGQQGLRDNTPINVGGHNFANTELFRLDGCQNIAVIQNILTSNQTLPIGNYVNKGIAVYNSQNCQILNNSAVKLMHDYYFNGNCLPTFFRGNQMATSQIGYTLDNSAEIGVQGNLTTACGNYWTGTLACYTNVSNNTAGIPNANSQWFCQSPNPLPKITMPAVPSLNCATPPFLPYSIFGDLWPISFSYPYPTSVPQSPCAAAPTQLITSGEEEFYYSGTEENLKQAISSSDLFEKLGSARSNEIKLMILQENWIQKFGKTDSIKTLGTWDIKQLPTDLKFFAELKTGQPKNSIPVFSSFNSTDLWLSSRTFVYTVQHRIIKGELISKSDIQRLYEIGLSCYDEVGSSKYSAISLLKVLGEIMEEWDLDMCMDENNQRVSGKHDVSKSDFKVFPNPNQGSFTITGNFGKVRMDKVSVMLKDVSGRKIPTESIKFVMNESHIEVSGLRPGVYFYVISNFNGALLDNGKVIVMD